MWRLLGHSSAALLRSHPARVFSSSTQHCRSCISDDLYQILGVGRSASHEEIRAAFLTKAKELHPDLRNEPGESAAKQQSCNVPAFVALVSAYEVLRSPKRRLQYDDVSRRHGGAMANQLASRGGTASPARAHHQDVVDAAEAEADRWLQWLYHVVGGRAAPKGTLVHYDGGALRAALLEAYLGPWVDVSNGFPPCFEAEERNAGLTGVNDLLHIVSGRQLLGTVRISSPKQLPGPSDCPLTLASPSILEGRGHGPPPEMQIRTVRREEMTRGRGAEFDPPDNVGREEGGAGCSSMGGRPRRPADCHLELVMGGKVVARAARSPAGSELNRVAGIHGGSSCFPAVRCTPDGALDQDLISVWVLPEHSAGDRDSVEMELTAHVAGLRDQGVLGTPGSDGHMPVASILARHEMRRAATFDHSGRLTHTVVAHRTVGVRALTWVQRGLAGQVECRCSRAWMPPSQYWLFEPRVETHSEGSWYFERYTRDSPYTSRRQQRRMGQVLPAPVHILVAAYESLDEEHYYRNLSSTGARQEPEHMPRGDNGLGYRCQLPGRGDKTNIGRGDDEAGEGGSRWWKALLRHLQ